jgi:F0F1-type ATP synthase membrane subunit b/b'
MKILIAYILTTGIAYASGKAGHGSATDLIAPFVNVIALVAFLVWKLKGPLRNSFIEKSEKISETLERASVKSKEAKILLETQEKKLAGLPNDLQNIKNQAESDAKTFANKYKEEVMEKSEKLRQDAISKIQAEKKSMLNSVNEKLIDDIIARTSTQIKSDNNLKTKINRKITEGIE